MSSRYLKLATVLSLSGTLFAGYLSGVKLFTKTCAFNEPCPDFLGYPACWYGLAMFGAMLVASLLGLFGKLPEAKAARANAFVSFAGVLFAGYFTVREVVSWVGGGVSSYGLGLPTCAYGLVFYVALLVASLVWLRRKNAPSS